MFRAGIARIAARNRGSARGSGLRSISTSPSILPCDTDGLEVVFAMGVVAGDGVELYRVISVHRQCERQSETRAFLLIVVFHAIDRGAPASQVPRIQCQPATGR